MINFQKAEFIKSAFSKDDHLSDFSQVLFIGKSNVGKSSLINALTNKKSLAYVSKTPGQTKLVNYYLIDNCFYLVDVPGFGYRKLAYEKDNFEPMMEGYLKDNKNLKVIFYFIDSRREFTNDEEDVIRYINNLGFSLVLVFTKCDKLKQSEKSKLVNTLKFKSIENYLFVSINDVKLLNNLKEKIVSFIE